MVTIAICGNWLWVLLFRPRMYQTVVSEQVPALSLFSCVWKNLLKVRSASFLSVFSAFPNASTVAVPGGSSVQYSAVNYRTLFAAQREVCSHPVEQFDFISVKCFIAYSTDSLKNAFKKIVFQGRRETLFLIKVRRSECGLLYLEGCVSMHPSFTNDCQLKRVCVCMCVYIYI